MGGSRVGRVLCGGIAATLLLVLAGAASAFSGWTVSPTPSPGAYGSLLKDVSARSGGVWAVGSSATTTSNQTLAARWNGTNWSVTPSPNPVPNCQDGNPQWAGNTLNAVAVVATNDVWAVGNSCYSTNTLVERWNGTSWRIVASPSFQTGGDGVQNWLSDVAAVSATNVWAVGSHTAANGAYQTLVERWDGAQWRVVPSPSPSSTSNVLSGVAATGASDIWAVGRTSASTLIEHWNGAGWSVVAGAAVPQSSVLNAVSAISPTDVWAVGSKPAPTGASATLVEHWDGMVWKAVPSPNLSTEYGSANVLRSIAAVSPNDVWAVGVFQNESTGYHQHRTLTLHWDGSTWKVVASATPGASGELNAVTALPTGQLWAAGLYSNYEINIYDGSYTAPRTLVLRG
jgi:hypothetical protein